MNINDEKHLRNNIYKKYDELLEDGITIDMVPPGWLLLLDDALEAIKKEVNRNASVINGLKVTKAKNRYGRLHIETNYDTRPLGSIIAYYEFKSQKICQECGGLAPMKWSGQHNVYCEDCYEKKIKRGPLE